MSRVIKESHVADVKHLSEDEKNNGIPDQNRKDTWVPIEKGFKKSDLYHKPSTEYIDWSKDSVNSLQNASRARWQGYEYFFREGAFISRGGFADLKARYVNNSVIDNTGTILSPIDEEVLSSKYLVGLLNSEIPIQITENFINSSGMETSDIRFIPVPIPTNQELNDVESLVVKAIKIQKDEEQGDVEEIHNDLDQLFAEIYDIEI
jgi:hypothetical protein